MNTPIFDLGKIKAYPAWRLWLMCLFKPLKYRMVYSDGKLIGVVSK